MYSTCITINFFNKALFSVFASGYIPSSVYTRSQYRSQQYPTLSTRSHSVPADESRGAPRGGGSSSGGYSGPAGQQGVYTEAPGGLYNIPHQRTSLACHSVDDLDTSSSSSSPHINTNTITSTTHSHHHPHIHQQHHRPRTDSQDRCG